MHDEFHAFADELSKIAEVQKKDITREKLMRALKAGAASAGGFGVGWGLGHLAAPKVLPAAAKHAPLVLGGLGSLAALSNQLWKNRAMKYIDQPDKPESA